VTLSEADTRSKLVDPKLIAAGWGEEAIQREYPYKRGKVILVGDTPIRETAQFVDYVLRRGPEGPMIAVVEAKSEDSPPGAGLQQAVGYAEDLGVPFAYSSNGHGIVEHDLTSAKITQLDSFPSPTVLSERLVAAEPLMATSITGKRGGLASNPLIWPSYVSPTGERLRYYQEVAIQKTLEEIVGGRSRGLLALATGTGKTFIAANLVWKLRECGYLEKVLFLVDRVSLLNQAYNDFRMFRDARGVVTSRSIPTFRDVHFATYQTLYSDRANGHPVYRGYDSNYFDLVIVDEAHRSGYGDWRVILDYFSSAFQLGMTATPKRTDSIDTYEYFGNEKLSSGSPQPAYEYSLGDGISDGFLATYQVLSVSTNLDVEGLHIGAEVEKGAELFVPEDAEIKDYYAARAFEREILVGDRTRVLCEHLASKIRNWGANEKTMVFCVNMDHAELVRQTMQNLLGPDTGKSSYAVRIVSEEKDAQRLLEAFQNPESAEPVLATTVDLLTTGVNVPAVRNIVFMKPIGSATVFKQIIGRGSRLDPTTGKEYFRIIDYTGATRLFDSWDVPPEVNGELPREGEAFVLGRVTDGITGAPIMGASITIVVGRATRASKITDTSGRFKVDGLPAVDVTVLVASKGYGRRRSRVFASENPMPLDVALRPTGHGGNMVEISGVLVEIADEAIVTLGDGGQQLDPSEYVELAGGRIREAVGDALALRRAWRTPKTRLALNHQLQEQRVDPEILSLVLDRPDADDYDLLAHAAYGEPIRTREERARGVQQAHGEDLGDASALRARVAHALLDNYRIAGVEGIVTAAVFQLPAFSDQFGGLAALTQRLGGPAATAGLLREVEGMLYPDEENAE
jgi:type I restriction enzyme, R subunit